MLADLTLVTTSDFETARAMTHVFPQEVHSVVKEAKKREPLGVRTRRLQRKILMADRSITGHAWLMFHMFIKPVHNTFRMLPLLKMVGLKVKEQFGISIYRQVIDQCWMVWMTGAAPWAYYMCELYRKDGMRYAGEWVMRNPTKHGIWKALNRLDPQAKNRARKLGDKVAVAAWCAEFGLPHPQPIILVERGEVIWQGQCKGDLDRDLFIKLRDGRGARGAGAYRRVGPLEYVGGDHRLVTVDQLLAHLKHRSLHRAQMVLPYLHNHSELADFADESLLTIRVMTCLDRQLRPEVTNLYLRSMCKLEPSWDVGRIREFAATIDPETGRLGPMTGDRPECLSDWFDRHPITDAPVTGRIVPFWRELMILAMQAHDLVPERVIVGWDFAITDTGPVLLEGNNFTDVLYPQRVSREPFGRTRLGELMHHHLDRMEAKLAEAPGFFLTN
jgi:hypothetical protein